MTPAQAEVHAGAWKLAPNDVWNVPDGVIEVRHEIETRGPWNIISKIRGLVIDREGRIYGERSLSRPQEDGYCQRGYVSIGGKKHRAYTGAKLFERPDGSLCNVAVLFI